MQSNVQVTPQMAELGAAIVAAVEMILNDPNAAKKAAQAHLDAHTLNAEQVDDYNEAMDLIKQAAALRSELQQGVDDVDAREKKLAADQETLGNERAQHSANVDALNQSQKAHDAKLKQLEVREHKLEEEEEEMKRNWQLLRQAEEAVKKREDAIREREEAAKEFARKIGGGKAA